MNIAVLGAGIGGLAAAYDLVKAGHKVTIYEAENYIGGLAAGFKEPEWDWSLERYYHHWFASDRHMLGKIVPGDTSPCKGAGRSPYPASLTRQSNPTYAGHWQTNGDLPAPLHGDVSPGTILQL